MGNWVIHRLHRLHGLKGKPVDLRCELGLTIHRSHGLQGLKGKPADLGCEVGLTIHIFHRLHRFLWGSRGLGTGATCERGRLVNLLEANLRA